jgi:exopolyphosphatase / guanosine-5'-triphosphate,3'-diphosphate pyrophosphatase
MSIVAGIDLGTNSLRIVIAQKTDNGTIKTLFKKRDLVRMGYKVNQTGLLQEKNINETITALKNYLKAMKKHHVSRYIFIATSATRDAKNAADFTKQLEKIPLTPTIISGSNEAKLVAKTIDSTVKNISNNSIFVDQGGGSTEFIHYSNHQVKKSTSLNIGVVRLSEQFIKTEIPQKSELTAINNHLKKKLNQLDVYKNTQADQLILLGGTGSAISRIYNLSQAKENPTNEITLTYINEILTKALTLSHKEKESFFNIDPMRADVMIAGIIQIKSILEYFNLTKLQISTRGLRYGLINILLNNEETTKKYSFLNTLPI